MGSWLFGAVVFMECQEGFMADFKILHMQDEVKIKAAERDIAPPHVREMAS